MSGDIEHGDIEHLDTDDLLELTRRLLGEPLPLRDPGLLGAAATRPWWGELREAIPPGPT